MNEYNERILKNVLLDMREENDTELLKEIEAAANDPLYQNGEGEAENFAKNYAKGTKKKFSKVLFRVASLLLVLAVAAATIPITVEGRKNTICELIINYVSSEYFSVGIEDPFISFEGKYVPSWIPVEYEVASIKNSDESKEILLKNSDGNIITYWEVPHEMKINVDSTEFGNIENIEINGFNAIYIENETIRTIIINTEESILYITSDDENIDLKGFAELIEKR